MECIATVFFFECVGGLGLGFMVAGPGKGFGLGGLQLRVSGLKFGGLRVWALGLTDCK